MWANRARGRRSSGKPSTRGAPLAAQAATPRAALSTAVDDGIGDGLAIRPTELAQDTKSLELSQ